MACPQANIQGSVERSETWFLLCDKYEAKNYQKYYNHNYYIVSCVFKPASVFGTIRAKLFFSGDKIGRGVLVKRLKLGKRQLVPQNQRGSAEEGRDNKG